MNPPPRVTLLDAGAGTREGGAAPPGPQPPEPATIEAATIETVTAAAAGPVQAALDRFFAAGAGHDAGPEHRELWSALTEAATGGKGLRPVLFHSVYRALGGHDEEAAAEVGAALELLHTALVIHDDVIDGDTMRRHRPNVAGTFATAARAQGHRPERAAHYGQTAAILAGDLALAGVVRMLALCGAPPHTVTRMLDLLDRALHLSAAGELTDVRLSMAAEAEVGTAIGMEYQKTAVYSFELPLQLACVLADAGDDHEQRLVEFGRLLGVTYQLYDDLDGMFGEETRIGKSVLSDLREGKCTPLIAHARATPQWEQIRPYLGSESVDSAGATQVRALLEEAGSRAYVENLARDLAEQAQHSVTGMVIAPLLRRWVDVVTGRTP